MSSSAVLSTALILGFAFATGGCGSTSAWSNGHASDSTNEHAGDVSLDLQLANGTTLSSVSYTIVGPSAYTKTGSFDVNDSSVVSATIGGIPAGAGYTITLSGSSTDAALSCGGSASFNVVAHQTTLVNVAVTCKEAPKTGSVLVNGALNICPLVDGVMVTPSELAWTRRSLSRAKLTIATQLRPR